MPGILADLHFMTSKYVDVYETEMDVKLQTQSQELKSTNSGEPGGADKDN